MLIRRRRSKQDVNYILRYYQNLQREADILCGIRNYEFRLDFSKYIKNPEQYATDEWFNSVGREGDQGQGFIYRETLDTVLQVVDRICKGESLSLLGLIQTAKSASQIVGAIIGATVKYLWDGERACVPIFFTPRGHTYHGQFNRKFDALWNGIKDVVVMAGHCRTPNERKPEQISCRFHDKIQLSEYYNELIFSLSDKIKETLSLPETRHLLGRKKCGELFKQIRGLQFKHHIVLPMTSTVKELFRLMVSAVGEADCTMIIVRDEAHYAVGKDSINDKMFLPQPKKNKKAAYHDLTDLDIYEILNDSSLDHQIILVSATNWCGLHLPYVLVGVNENYCGIDFGFIDRANQLVQIAKSQGVTIRRPDLIDFDDAGRLWNSDFQYIRPMWYTDEMAFLDALEVQRLPFSGWHNYRKRMTVAIRDVVTALLIDENPKKKRGVLMRFCNNNEQMDQLISELRPILDSRIKIIREYGSKHEVIEDLLEAHGVGENDLYLIIATAGARMGDTYPIHCGYGIDLTFESSTMAALLQGILGRIGCGYNKNPLILMSPTNVQTVRDYEDNDHLPLPGMTLLGTAKASRDRNAFKFDSKKTECPLVHQICNEITTHIVRKARTKPIKSAPFKTIQLGRFFYKSKRPSKKITEIIGGNEFEQLSMIASANGIRLLGFDEMDQCGRAYELIEGEPVLTTRVRTKDGSDKSGGKNSPHMVIRVEAGPGGHLRCTAFDLLAYNAAKADVAIDEESVPGKVKRK